MLDEQDLLAIGKLIDQKLEEKLEAKLEEKLNQKLAQQKEEIITEATHRMQVLLDAEVKPQFNLLAEELSIIREKMIPESRIEAVEDDVSVLKASVRRINQDIRELKQAQ